MSPRANELRATALPALALVAAIVLPGCSSVGDLGTLQPSLVTDGIHDWVGRDAARAVGAPVSANNLTDDERTLRDLAFPLIEQSYDRQRWDAVIYEYGINRLFQRELWIDDATAYYRHLRKADYRSTAGRYNQLIDDIRNDIVRLDPFFTIARRVVDLDRRREASMQSVADLSPAERLNAQARIGENSLVVAWVQHSLTERCAGYRFALEHLAVAEPQPAAAEADQVLTELQQQIAANGLAPAPHFAGVPATVAARQ
jgi:hypothetical protein